jgi:hypothetical protein
MSRQCLSFLKLAMATLSAPPGGALPTFRDICAKWLRDGEKAIMQYALHQHHRRLDGLSSCIWPPRVSVRYRAIPALEQAAKLKSP